MVRRTRPGLTPSAIPMPLSGPAPAFFG